MGQAQHIYEACEETVFPVTDERYPSTKADQGMQEELGQRCTVRQLQGGAKEATAIPSCCSGRFPEQPPGGMHPSPCVRHRQEGPWVGWVTELSCGQHPDSGAGLRLRPVARRPTRMRKVLSCHIGRQLCQAPLADGIPGEPSS